MCGYMPSLLRARTQIVGGVSETERGALRGVAVVVKERERRGWSQRRHETESVLGLLCWADMRVARTR